MNQAIPFPLEHSQDSRLTIKDSRYLTVFALAAIKALAETGRSSAVIWHGEPPALPYETDTWDLMKVENEFSLPIDIQRRINIIRRRGIPIKQILIAHEHPSREMKRLEELKQLELKEAESLRRDHEAVRRKEINGAFRKGLYNLIIGVSTIVAAVAVVAALATMIVPVLIGLVCIGALVVGLGYDPVVVCILDDGSESWLMAGYWYE